MQADQVIDWVVLAGGFGTRSADPSRPKILQRVGGTTLLARHLVNVAALGPSRIVFVLHHGADQVRSELESERLKHSHLDIVVAEDAGVGAVPALGLGLSLCISETVGLILGDTYINADLQRLVRSWRSSGRKMGVVGRVSDHIFDSDSVSINHELSVAAYSHKGDATTKAGHLFGLTGLAFFDRGTIKMLSENAKDAIPAILEDVGVLECSFVPALGHFRDTGTPERLASAEKLDSLLPKMGAVDPNPGAVFFDRDDTLIRDESRGRVSLAAGDLNMELVRRLAVASERGISLHMVSNQPAIAKGWTTFEDTYAVNNELATMLLTEGVKVTTMQFCPHHPEPGFQGEITNLKILCECRKPGTGMFLNAAKVASIDLKKSIMVGDSAADEQAAQALKMQFQGIVWGNRNARLSTLEAWIDTH